MRGNQVRFRLIDTRPYVPRPIAEGSEFREETIYFLLTTRFYDGDPTNSFFCPSALTKTDPSFANKTDPVPIWEHGLLVG